MTKHASGKYGRTIGQKERKAGWPAPATAWCYLCASTHRWDEGCTARESHPALSTATATASRRAA